jgi:hypothetical protein
MAVYVDDALIPADVPNGPRVHADLSDGSPGHWCVLPGRERGRELEAG